MKQVTALIAALATAVSVASGLCAAAVDDAAETISQLTLADLAAYRAALSGKATADSAESTDPPVKLVFRDLWEHSDRYRGRRVTVDGRVSRIFRQGPVGQFPALAEIWINSSVGDPFCVVVPQGKDTKPSTAAVANPAVDRALRPFLGPGTNVRITGTFLKMLRYTAGDAARVAPLIVGDQAPVIVPGTNQTVGARATVARGAMAAQNPLALGTWSPASWLTALLLIVVVGSLLARRHLEVAFRPRRVPRRAHLQETADPPLEFVDQASNP
jgi:hypothetical protein